MMAAAVALALRIVLVGDSTVAEQQGWGPALRLHAGRDVEVVNLGANGRSSKSYRAEARWTEALAAKGDWYLIQFGHNDQPGKGPERETDPATFRENLGRYVDEASAIGARPVLLTSLTRRTFEGERIVSTLGPWVEATRAVAAEKGVPLVDLNAASTRLTERMGNAAWEAISPRNDEGGVDRTHLTPAGAGLVAPLVVAGLRVAAPELALHLADAVVAADGRGQHLTIQAAIDAVPQDVARWTIRVAAGRYHEVVYVQQEKRHVRLVGEDADTTVLTHGLHAKLIGLDGRPIGTFRTPTLTVDADDFTLEHLTVENTAGPVGQALALRVDGDRAAFRDARFLGWQDTVFLNRGRQLFERCRISGHVDFIFGGATAYFDGCEIHVRGDGYVTAASTPPGRAHGFVFRGCRITGEPGARAYLGRPWRGHAKTVFVDTWMSEAVRPEGWHDWDRPERQTSATYVEAGSTGPGADGARRVRWARTSSAEESRALTPAAVLAGADGWLRGTVRNP
jgi:pectinesterase